MLIKNVGKGKFGKMDDKGERYNKYRATAPNAPPIATVNIFKKVSMKTDNC